MSKSEEVKKILTEVATQAVLICPDTPSEYYYALQVCQLFPRSVDNPDGYEPKPVDTELLTEDDISELWWQAENSNKETPADIVYDFAKGIVKEIVSILKAQEQARVEELVREIETHSHPMNTNMHGISLSRDAWQVIKKEVKDEQV